MITNGIDIVRVESINKIKKLSSMFTSSELEYFASHKSIETKAGVFAAKEALLKSLGVNLSVYSILDIEVLHNNGMPYFNFYGKLSEYIKKERLKFSLSITHDEVYAVASVVCYTI